MSEQKPILHLILIEDDELQDLLKTQPHIMGVLQRISRCSGTLLNDGTWNLDIMAYKFGVESEPAAHYKRECKDGVTAIDVLTELMENTGEDIFAPSG